MKYLLIVLAFAGCTGLEDNLALNERLPFAVRYEYCAQKSLLVGKESICARGDVTVVNYYSAVKSQSAQAIYKPCLNKGWNNCERADAEAWIAWAKCPLNQDADAAMTCGADFAQLRASCSTEPATGCPQ